MRAAPFTGYFSADLTGLNLTGSKFVEENEVPMATVQVVHPR